MEIAEQERIFGEWMDQYKGLFFKFVRAYAFTPVDRDDLFQEISIQVWRSIPNFRGEASPMTWLYRISINTALSWVRKENKRKDGQDEFSDVNLVLRDNPAKDEQLEWLYTQIATLGEIDRSLTLLLLDGFSYKEMATLLGITESNVGVKINRIKKRLIEKSKTTYEYGI